MTTANRWWLVAAVVSVVALLGNEAMLVALGGDLLDTTTTAGGVAFAVTGALVVARRPDNVVGRLLIAMGMVWALGQGADHYLAVHLHRPLPAVDVVAWINAWAFYFMLPLAALVTALFPSGRLTSVWMRWPVRVAIAAGAVSVGLRMVLPLEAERQAFGAEFASNPWAVEVLAPLAPLAEAMDYVQVVVLVVAIVDLVRRWRHSTGIERLQMRFLALGLSVFAVQLTVALVAEAAGVEGMANELLWIGAWSAPGLAALPVAIGLAITRYRLYDIDRLMSRTVTYALLAMVLAAVYAGGVFAVRGLLPVEGEVAVAASTLAVAALFNPVRRRIRERVDRRFNRSRYDVQRVVESFGRGLRDEVDAGRVVDGCLDVVARTMQPVSSGVWLREVAR